MEEVKKILRSLLISSPSRATVSSLDKDYQNIVGTNIPYAELGYNSLQQFLHSIPDVLRVNGSNYHSEVLMVHTDKSAHVNEMVMKQRRNNTKFVLPKKRIIHTSDETQQIPDRRCISDYKDVSQDYVKNPTSKLGILKRKCQFRESIPIKISSENSDNFNVVFKKLTQKSNMNIPTSIQENLIKLIKKYPTGIWCTKLLREYKNMFGVDLSYEKYGFSSLCCFCMNLDNIFFCRKESSFDFKLYDKNGEIPELILSDKEEPPKLERFKVDPKNVEPIKSNDWEKYSNIIPDCAMILGEKIDFNSDFIIGDSVSVIISEICNPSEFWFYKDPNKLNKMMDSIQLFYRENETEYIIPEILLEKGLYCIVLLENEFQRAMIVDMLEDIGGYVRVYCIDYGSTLNLPMNKIYYLSKDFNKLPSQAIKACLANIIPKNETWCKESIKKFREFVQSHHIHLTFNKNENNIIHVTLGNLSKPKKSLNDILVEEGYAKYNYIVTESITNSRMEALRKLMRNCKKA